MLMGAALVHGGGEMLVLNALPTLAWLPILKNKVADWYCSPARKRIFYICADGGIRR